MKVQYPYRMLAIDTYHVHTVTNLSIRLQTNPQSLPHPSHSCNNFPSGRIRSLLQKLPPVHSNTHIRNHTGHLPWTDAAPGYLFFDTARVDNHTYREPGRVLLCLRLFPKRCFTSTPSTTAYLRRDCTLLLLDPPPKILSASRALTLSILPAPQRSEDNCIQCRSYSRGNNLASTTWHGIHRLRCRLEPGPRECAWRRSMVGCIWGRC